MGNYLGPDLDELELDAGERPVQNILGEGEAAHEVAEVVGENEQGQAHPVGGKPRARKPLPGEDVSWLFKNVVIDLPKNKPKFAVW